MSRRTKLLLYLVLIFCSLESFYRAVVGERAGGEK